MGAITNKVVRDEKLKGFDLKRLFEKRAQMTRLILLQFLEPEDICKLALTCKGMKKVIDPNACDEKDSKHVLMHFATILVIQKLSSELTEVRRLGNQKTLDDIYAFGVDAALFKEIFGIEPVLLLKDLGSTNKLLYHEAWSGSGFCYRRRNQELKATEYIAYAGYFGAHTDNPQYWKRKRMPNSLLLRDALVLNYVCWFSVATKIDKVPLLASKKYDLFLYHGCTRNIGLDDDVMAMVEINVDGKNVLKHNMSFVKRSE